jgi:HPt (histidine-containing phosphotransfer) domain-containing protein
MAYQAGALDATLAAAAGEDLALLAELRAAFVESLARQVDLLRRARCDGNWQVAALRLRGLAASFHAEQLVLLADDALEAAPGEPTVVRRLQAFLDDFAAV